MSSKAASGTAPAGPPGPGHGHGPKGPVSVLAFGALGIVYGDIGTSPLSAFREAFHGHGHGHGHELAVTETNVLGVLSLVFGSLVVVISIKYLLFVMRADNNGEGGILALVALVRGDGRPNARRNTLILLGVFGTALLYGDAAITPAISVLSAVEGMEIAGPALKHWVIPISCAILVGLFLIQQRGTTAIGRFFGPVMVVWFSVLAVLGGAKIVSEPGVLRAVNPLYADMGHFGLRPIKAAWFAMVLPALLLNYFGQGALLIADHSAPSSSG